MFMHLTVLVLGAFPIIAQSPACKLLGTPAKPSFSQDGDVSIGGVFFLHRSTEDTQYDFTTKPKATNCVGVYLTQFQLAQTMIFAIEEINNRTDILPGVTLGYKIYDTCGTVSLSVRAAMALMNGYEETLTDTSCSKNAAVQAIIGESESTSTIVMASTVGIFQIPVISHISSCGCLSDREKYPTFFRTIRGDNYKGKVLAQLVKHFGWTWVGGLRSDSDYGNSGMAIFEEAAKQEGICFEYSEKFHRTEPEKLLKIINIIKKSTAKVIIALLGQLEMKIFLEQITLQNLTGFQFIGPEGWITGLTLAKPTNFRFLGGSIGISIKGAKISGLNEFVLKLHPSMNPNNSDVQDFWETSFDCYLTKEHSSRYKSPCTGAESLYNLKNDYTDESDLRITNNVYKAVYAIAHSLHNLLGCTSQGCTNTGKIIQRQVVESLKKVNFTLKTGEQLLFNKDGDPESTYEVVNWQLDANGAVQCKTVGYYDPTLPVGQQFIMIPVSMVWAGGQKQKPRSVCSESCPPGTRKAVQKGRPVCCYDCVPCAEGEISNVTDSNDCIPCDPEKWSNVNRNKCILKAVEFLSFEELMGIVLVFFSLLGTCVTVSIAVVFFINKDTPIVKANNSELSFLLLFALILCFLCSLTFISQPSQWSCMLRHTAFGVTFVLCISCVLGKTIVVLMAFRATLPGSNVMKWFGPAQQRMSVVCFTFVQMLICILWLSLSPPFPIKNTSYYKDRIILECNLGSTSAFWAVLGYIGLLSLLCFVLAFLARKLPDNFNEAKFITFSMLIFCAVWITFIPAYVSSPGKFTVVVEIFAILASSYGLLFCIFAPKCYIILLKPELNSRKHLMGKIPTKAL